MTTLNRVVVDDFMDHLEHIQRRSPQTVRTYGYTLHYWLDWLGDRRLADVRPQDVETWARRERRTGKAPSAHTMRREIVVVRTFHQWAAERDYGVAMVLSAHAPSVRGRTPKPVSDELWRTVWDSDLEDSTRMFLGLGYWGGLRRIEMVTLTPEQVDMADGVMRPIRKGGSPEPVEYLTMGGWLEGEPCHRGFERWVDIFHATVENRKRLKANRVWWEGVGADAPDSERMARRLRAALRNAGLPEDAFTLHQLRHSCATNLLAAGCPPHLVRDALSHASFDMTSRYAKTSGQMARELQKRKKADPQ